MPPETARQDHRDESRERRIGCTVLLIVALLLLLLAVALFWRSAWWIESGAPIPQGTSVIEAAPGSVDYRSVPARTRKGAAAPPSTESRSTEMPAVIRAAVAVCQTRYRQSDEILAGSRTRTYPVPPKRISRVLERRLQRHQQPARPTDC